MLDFVYYPVSAVLWLWHTGFAALFGAASGLSWVLAIVLLVVTLRLILLRPFLAQVKFQRTMAVIQPRMKEIRARHAGDQERQVAEMRKLQQEHPFNVMSMVVPMIVQTLMFLGLYHVLRSFDRTGGGFLLGHKALMNAQQNAVTANYLFPPEQVQSFLHAKVLGAQLSSTLLTAGGSFATVAAVVLPLAAVAAVATHLTARASVTRQVQPVPQARLINSLTMWLFPVFSLIGALIMPVGIVVYFVTSNLWTFAQQHYVHRKLGPMPTDTVPATALRDE